MKTTSNHVYLVYRQSGFNDYSVVRVFKKKKDADKYCKDKNDKHQPEFDDYGHYEGIYHSHAKYKVE